MVECCAGDCEEECEDEDSEEDDEESDDNEDEDGPSHGGAMQAPTKKVLLCFVPFLFHHQL